MLGERLERDRRGVRLAVSQVGCLSSRSGRARQTTRIGASRLQPTRYSIRSRKVGSAHWRSSKPTTAGDRGESARKAGGQPRESRRRPRGLSPIPIAPATRLRPSLRPLALESYLAGSHLLDPEDRRVHAALRRTGSWGALTSPSYASSTAIRDSSSRRATRSASTAVDDPGAARPPLRQSPARGWDPRAARRVSFHARGRRSGRDLRVRARGAHPPRRRGGDRGRSRRLRPRRARCGTRVRPRLRAGQTRALRPRHKTRRFSRIRSSRRCGRSWAEPDFRAAVEALGGYDAAEMGRRIR